MYKMRNENYSERSFKWTGDLVSCPDENLSDKNYVYEFYTECEIDGVKYEVGLGVQTKIESEQNIGIIHYFYEIPTCTSRAKRYIAALELFYKPSEIVSSLVNPKDLDHDLEVIKKEHVTLLHVPVFVIKSRCIVVYGLHDEDPQDLLHEFVTTTSDTIYICRFVACLEDGLFYLKGAIDGTGEEVKTESITIDDNDEVKSEPDVNIDNDEIKSEPDVNEDNYEVKSEADVNEDNDEIKSEHGVYEVNDEVKSEPDVTEDNEELITEPSIIEDIDEIRTEPNTTIESSDNEQSAGNYVVDHIEDNIACNIIIKLKRQQTSPAPEEVEVIPDEPEPVANKNNLAYCDCCAGNSKKQAQLSSFDRNITISTRTQFRLNSPTKNYVYCDCTTGSAKKFVRSSTPEKYIATQTQKPVKVYPAKQIVKPVEVNSAKQIVKPVEVNSAKKILINAPMQSSKTHFAIAPKKPGQVSNLDKIVGPLNKKPFRLTTKTAAPKKVPIQSLTAVVVEPRKQVPLKTPQKTVSIAPNFLVPVIVSVNNKPVSPENSPVSVNNTVLVKRTESANKTPVSATPPVRKTRVSLKNTPKKEPPVSIDITTSKKNVPLILAKKAQQSSSELMPVISQQSPSELMSNLTILSPKKQRELPSQEQVTNMNKSIKQMNKRKQTLPNLREISDNEEIQVIDLSKNVKEKKKRKPYTRKAKIRDSDDDVIMTEINTQPVVVLNKIDLNIDKPEVQSSAKIQTRRSSRAKSTETPSKTLKRQTSIDSDDISLDKRVTRTKLNKTNNDTVSTPSRSSRRQAPKVSYEEYYDSSPEKRSARTRFNKTYDDFVVSSPRSTKKVSNTRNDESATTTNKIVEETPSKTKKSSVTFDDTPTTNSVRKKRTVSSSEHVTPKKQSKIINTPRSGRLNIMTMTPTIEEREEPIVFCNTPMSRARMGLSAYSVPLKVPCRENEYLNIYNFVTGRLLDQSSGCMYISGVPGTGKTMTVCRVMNDLSKEKDEYSDFEFLKLNALALTEPRQIYVEIVKKLINKKLHWEESLKEIERFFKAKKKKVPHVILVDELDKLCNRKQDVVYNLLDLPFHSVTPLIVITIANTMDLPERILTNKVNSRLGLVRLTFKPYQYKDLVKIVTERLATDAVFKNEALELVARKVAAVSGDARRALAMCSRATEIAEEENKELVTMDIVDKVLKEMSSSSKVQAIQCCSKLEKHILTAIANEVTRTGNEEVPFLNMMHNLEKFCLFESFKLPSPEVCLKACHNLGSFRLLITQHGKIDINMTLMLNISTDDVHYALRE